MARKNGNLVNTAYQKIREKIITYELAPGAIVSDYLLATEFGMSRAPVREAILLLSADGLIENGTDGKSRVSDIGYSDIMDIMSVRRALEEQAVRTIAKNGWLTESQLAEIHKQISDSLPLTDDALDILKNNRSDDGFHTAIIRFSNNKRMLTIIERLNTQMLRARWVNVALPTRLKEVQAEHDAIYKALEKQDLNAVIKASHQHLDNSEKTYDLVFKNPNLRQVMAGIHNFLKDTN